ncbi:hypothetical protein METSCH_C02710 [Metschnikowia aff. pulcherrima]|uniref:Uncharacterized protein n=1 Tax=Metschnikowia aff. pulcherrima TaxID=2163413 RepID=A0A4P6XNU4_9ASCO|nr:hypothetical protein METSCH_C02710 [Metschnikowia aff. pulcherrima]
MVSETLPISTPNDQINLFPWLSHHPALAEAFLLHCETNSALLQKVTKTIDLQLDDYIDGNDKKAKDSTFVDPGSQRNDQKLNENMGALKGTSEGRQKMEESHKEHQSLRATVNWDVSNANNGTLKRLKELTIDNLYIQTLTKLDNARLMSPPYASISGVQVFNTSTNSDSFDNDLAHRHIQDDKRLLSRPEFGHHKHVRGAKIGRSAENAIVTSQRPHSHGLADSDPVNFSLQKAGESKNSTISKSSLVWQKLPLYIRAQINTPKGIPANGAHGSHEVHHKNSNPSLDGKNSSSDGHSKPTQSRVSKIREQRISNLLENSLNLHHTSMGAGAGTTVEDVDTTASNLVDEEITEADKTYVLPGSFAGLNDHIRGNTSSEELYSDFHDEILLGESQDEEQSEEETEILNHDSDEDLRLYSR